MIESGTATLRFPESVLGVFLQTISPLIPSLLFALFHINVLLTIISLVSKSRSVISNANNSFIRNADANSVLQMTLKRLFALVLGKVSR